MFRNLLSYAQRRPKEHDLVKKWKVVKGDTVEMIRGKDKGKKGVVTRVLRERNKVIVEGLNLVKKHVKPSEQSKGGILSKEAPVHISNVSLLDPQDNKPTRVRWGFLPPQQRNVGEFTKKGRVRISRRSSSIIPRPVTLGQRKKPKPKDGPKDTAPADVLERTFVEPEYVASVKAKRAEKAAKLKKQATKRRAAIARKALRIKAANDKRRFTLTGDDVPKEPKGAANAPAAPRGGGSGGAASGAGGSGLPLGSIFTSRPHNAPPPQGKRATMENVD